MQVYNGLIPVPRSPRAGRKNSFLSMFSLQFPSFRTWRVPHPSCTFHGDDGKALQCGQTALTSAPRQLHLMPLHTRAWSLLGNC